MLGASRYGDLDGSTKAGEEGWGECCALKQKLRTYREASSSVQKLQAQAPESECCEVKHTGCARVRSVFTEAPYLVLRLEPQARALSAA
eukprot:scaffold71089_cov17-Tisochrysis_lutea.AAC.1